jgi:hypothetical protein
MIPIAAIKPLLRYFDAIDRYSTAGLLFKTPFKETTITQILCSLLDQEEQLQAALRYSFKNLQDDLKNLIGGLRIEIKTNEYNSAIENKVTQSDLGLIINYINHYDESLCWTESWLFQAKTLKPSHRIPLTYSTDSKIDISEEQIKRIKYLEETVDADFIRFMEYCPRAHLLNRQIQDELFHYKNHALSGYNFNSALELELHDCLARQDQNLEPGIFISCLDSIDIENPIKSYKDLYKYFLEESHPFSWFILLRLSLHKKNTYDTPNTPLYQMQTLRNRINLHSFDPIPKLDSCERQSADLAYAIVSCNFEKANYILEQINERGIEGNFTIYPARTMTISIGVGN